MRRSVQVILASLAMVGISGHGAARAQGAPVGITIGQSSTSIPVNTPRLVDALGLFEKNGLKPTFVTMDSGAGSMTALVAGSVDFTTAGMDELLALRAQGQQSIAILINVYRGQSGIIVVSKDLAAKLPAKEGDPANARLKALNGVTVAAPSASSSMVGSIKLGAAAVGAEVKFTYMAQTAMMAAMSAKSIEAYIASSPFPDQAVDAGIAVRWIRGPKGEFPEAATTNAASALMVSRAYVERNPEIVRRVRAAFDEMVAIVRDHPDQALAALKKLYPDQKDSVIKSAFEENAPNWLHPDLSTADLRKEIEMRKGGSLQNLDKIDPPSLIISR